MANFFEAFKFSSWILFFLPLSPFKFKKKNKYMTRVMNFFTIEPF